MRRKNWRLISGGAIIMVLAGAFFLFMQSQVPRSNDPAGMMQMVGTVSGGVGGLCLVLVIAGLLGWEGLSKKS